MTDTTKQVIIFIVAIGLTAAASAKIFFKKDVTRVGPEGQSAPNPNPGNPDGDVDTTNGTPPFDPFKQ
jgi:hypothetical protein